MLNRSWQATATWTTTTLITANPENHPIKRRPPW